VTIPVAPPPGRAATYRGPPTSGGLPWPCAATTPPDQSADRLPTAASYLRARGDSEFRAFKLEVLPIEGGAIAEITTFDARLFPAFGLPPTR
jgi:hypothetical protein